MSKISLSDATSLANETSFLTLFNTNNANIENVSNIFLSRDGTSPNEMLANLDMNSNRILNLPAPSMASEPLRLSDLTDLLNGGLTVNTFTGFDSTSRDYTAKGSLSFDGLSFIDDNNTHWFSDWNTKAVVKIDVTNSDAISALTKTFRDALYVNHNITSSPDDNGNRHGNYGIRTVVTGPYANSLYSPLYASDLVGIDATVIARVETVNRGCSGITVSAIQIGQGICSNEFAVEQPADASTQSLSMAGLQAILSSKKADADVSHFVTGVTVTNLGKLATSAFDASSEGTDGDSGEYKYLLFGRYSTVTEAGIVMPSSASGDAGKVIEYDANDWTDYITSTNTYRWVIGGSAITQLSSTTLTTNAIVSTALTTGAITATTVAGTSVAASSSILSSNATAGIGYSTGAGGAVTQITSSSTGVTLNKITGQITTVALTTAAGAEEQFTVTDSAVAATDVVMLTTTYAGAGTPIVYCSKVAAGSFQITISNLHTSAALNAAMTLNFVVLKGTNS